MQTKHPISPPKDPERIDYNRWKEKKVLNSTVASRSQGMPMNFFAAQLGGIVVTPLNATYTEHSMYRKQCCLFIGFWNTGAIDK